MVGKQRGVGYEAIADILRSRIASGELPAGEKVPSENDLMEAYGVGRETAYKALRLLRDDGLTVSRQGAPTRVRKFEPIRRYANERLSAEVWGNGTSMWDIDVRDEKAKVTDVEVTRLESSSKVAAALNLTRGEPVVRRSRRYLLDGKPILRAISYLPAKIADGTPIAQPNTGPGGIYARLADLGHAPAMFREEVRVRMPTKEEKAQLKLDRGTPVIIVVRTASTAEGQAVEVNEMTMDSASYILDYAINA
ncbi:GntR family transcriptional regulator [Streptomyces microflavus]|uniref:GntR family transcriptional regulator n=1 Tax=Streptomyces microflavus TaxID=1919 RepID=UPI0033B9055B